MGEVDLVRALALAGVSSAVFIEPGNPARYSRSVVRALDWVDTWRMPEDAVERLLAFAATQPERPVLFYDGDWDLLIVSRHRDRLRRAFRFVVPDASLVEAVVDKAKFQALADRHELPVPTGYLLAAGSAPPRIDFHFPVVVKPLTRQHDSWRPLARAKAIRVTGGQELQALAGTMAEAGVDVMVQEEVDGPESRIASYHVYVDADGTIAGEFTGRKVRTFPTGYGYTTALSITDDPDTRALGRDVVGRIGLRGVAKLDFKRDSDDRLHLLEINPRFNLWHHPGAVAGVNLPGLVYADLLGMQRPNSRPVAPVQWCNVAHDLHAAKEHGISMPAWLAWAVRCETKSGFASSDPLPLPRSALWRINRRLSSAGRQAARSGARAGLAGAKG